MKIVAIIQARMGSTRLPGKALLPVAGHPAAALAALRAANNGPEVIVATSIEPADDKLVDILRSHGLPVFRGPLEDVLARYFLAAAHLPEDAAIVRLTADNVVPDGAFVRELASAFVTSGLDYLGGASPQNHLPYGLRGEVFSVAALRKAHAAATSPYDREHVGPWMGRNCKAGVFIPRALGEADYSHLRCTLDDKEDYQRILRLFEGVSRPVEIGWPELMEKLASLSGEPTFRVPYRLAGGRTHSEMVLGTAQLGMEYGRVNESGKPSREQAIAMVRQAIAHGVTALDTARAYGDAEEALEEALAGAWRSRVEVVTKLSPLPELAPQAGTAEVRAAVEESVLRSSRALGVRKLDTVLLHGWQYRHGWSGEAWRRLLEFREEGVIGRLGASVYEPSEALEALRDPDVRHLQIPINVLDRRWKAAGVDRAATARPDVVVHARSVLLQGILAHPADRWPILDVLEAEKYVVLLRKFVRDFQRENVADLCLAYVRAQEWITAVVVGSETMAQLDTNLKLFLNPKVTAQQCSELERAFPHAPEALLNPAKWKMSYEQIATER